MSVTDTNSFNAMLAGATAWPFNAVATAAKGAGILHSLWRLTSTVATPPVPPAAPGEVLTRASTGALYIPPTTAPTQPYLTNISLTNTVAGTIFFTDRLWHCAAINGTLTTVQPINAPALPRVTTGIGLQLFVEAYAASTGAATMTINYTNHAGQTRSVTVALASAQVIGQKTPVPLNDLGLSLTAPIQSIQLSVSAGAGSLFGLSIEKPIASAPLAANTLNPRGVFDLPSPSLDPDTCLSAYLLCTTANNGTVNGSYSVGVG